MNKSQLLGAVWACALTFYLPTSAEAVLIDRGGGLIYDSDQDLTFLQDAGVFNTSFTSAKSWAEKIDLS